MLYCILFDNHEQAVSLHAELKNQGFHSAIAPTPRSLTVCCGVCLMIRPEEYTGVKQYVTSHGSVYKSICEYDHDFNPKRDHYT